MPAIVNTRLHCILHGVRNYFKHQSHTRLAFCMQVKPGTPRKRNNRDANTSFSLRGMARGFGSGALLFGSLVVLRINDGLCRDVNERKLMFLSLYRCNDRKYGGVNNRGGRRDVSGLVLTMCMGGA